MLSPGIPDRTRAACKVRNTSAWRCKGLVLRPTVGCSPPTINQPAMGSNHCRVMTKHDQHLEEFISHQHFNNGVTQSYKSVVQPTEGITTASKPGLGMTVPRLLVGGVPHYFLAVPRRSSTCCRAETKHKFRRCTNCWWNSRASLFSSQPYLLGS